MKTEKSNSLAAAMPDLAKEWHPTKNGNLLPTDVACYSDKNVWWLVSYTDPETDKYFEFEWQSTVHNRALSPGCPFISGKRVWSGFNDLATKRPDIAVQWHPIRNGDLKASDVTEKSGQIVWWLLPYDDVTTGKHFDFEWQAAISNRTSNPGDGCPYLSGKAIYKGFNDLATLRPDLAKEWHPTKNDSLTPFDVTLHYGKKVWWYLPYDDPKTGHHDFEWEATVDQRVGRDVKCPYLSNTAVWVGYNDLETTHPDIAKKFHPTKNGNLTTKDFTYGSGKILWWLYKYYDKTTNKWFDFEWQACVKDVVRSRGECPHLSGKLVHIGFNDLATTHPHLAQQWNYAKNNGLKPQDVTIGSNKKVWWKYKYIDDKQKEWVFEWDAVIRSRKNSGCPYLTGKKVCKGFNDLETINPTVAKLWHPTKNKNVTPSDITISCGKRFWWYLQHFDKNTQRILDFEWQATVDMMTRTNGSCPFLANHMIYIGYNDLATTHPHLAKEWHPTKNKSLTPVNVHSGVSRVVWWYLPYDDPVTGEHFDFEWKSSISNRSRQNLHCPFLSNQKLWPGYNDLETKYPELAAEWHSTKNGHLRPCDVMPGSAQKVWWKKNILGKWYEWKAEIRYRVAGGLGCPEINISSVLELQVKQILDSLRIKHICQAKFADFRTDKGRMYSWDFSGMNREWLIECDGIQHFEYNDYFYKTQSAFEERIHYDNDKNLFANKNNIPLLRIPYTYMKNPAAIERVVRSFLEQNVIEDEIVYFYKQFKKSTYLQQ